MTISSASGVAQSLGYLDFDAWRPGPKLQNVDVTDKMLEAVEVARQESKTLYLSAGDYYVTETIVVESPARITMHPDARLVTRHNGDALVLKGWKGSGTHNIKVYKAHAFSWVHPSYTDTTSTGVRLDDCVFQTLTIAAEGYYRGIYLAGLLADGPIAHNNFFNIALVDNFIGIDGSAAPSTDPLANVQWANENHFYGGKIVNTSTSLLSGPMGPDSAYIKIHSGGNGWNFYSLVLEGSNPHRSIYCEGAWNIWHGCRFESASDIEFTSDSELNLVEFGNLFGGANDIFLFAEPDVIDDGEWNTFRSPLSSVLWSRGGDSDGRALLLATDNDPATHPAVEIRYGMASSTAAGTVGMQLMHDGRLGMVDAGGTFRYVSLSAAGGLLVDGAVAGATAPFTDNLGTGDGTATVFNNGGAGFVHNFGTATPTVTIYSDGQQISSGWHANLNADNNTVDSVEFGTAPGAGEVLTIKIGA